MSAGAAFCFRFSHAGALLPVLLLTLIGSPVLAAASPPPSLPLDFSWEAPPECPGGEAVRAQLERVVRVRAGRTPPRLFAIARVEQQGGRWLLHLRTQRDGVVGTRRLEAGSCAALVGAATLVLALAFGEGVELADETLVLDPRASSARGKSDASKGEKPSENAPVVEAPPPPPAPPAPEPPPSEPASTQTLHTRVVPAASPGPPWLWALGAAGRSGWGPLPTQAFGAVVGLDGGEERWFASLQIGVSPRSDQPQAGGSRVRFAGADATLSACGRAAASALTLVGCLGGQVNVVRSWSVGLPSDGPVLAPVYAVVPQIRAELPIFRSVSLQLGLAMATFLNRPRFALTAAGDGGPTIDVYRLPAVAPSATLGLGLRL